MTRISFYFVTLHHLAKLHYMDKMTKEQRHKCMSAIKSRDTKPELIVRKYLFRLGFRYRLNHSRLPGHPDIVLRKYRTVVFVNGCFWHGHEGCNLYSMPKTNTEFWKNKIQRNIQRDREERLKLASMGWHSITIWECQLKPAHRAQTLASLVFTLSQTFLSINKPKKEYRLNDPDIQIAAEKENPYSSGNV